MSTVALPAVVSVPIPDSVTLSPETKLPMVSTFEAALVVTRSTNFRASGPRISISPMWLTSNKPTRSRTVRCSSSTPEYCTGISQPPKSTIFAPMRRWV